MRRFASSLMITMAVGWAGAALAADPPQANAEVSYNGMKVAIDAKTGALRPLTAQESRNLDLAMSGGKGLKMVTLQQAIASKKKLVGGGVGMKLPAELMTTLTATVKPDGSVALSESGTHEELPSE
ncbi:MAG: hypothetical protein JWL98_1388 [Xanthomonadaceae bacterium]|nr:hypothetical protein [Xanthomonadaceae bacterium]